ncbi:MAG: ribonuclease P protein component [Calditrichaeota bacterium]|nr:MAG: ribonuclease P protein component [Calditrichota bacterium]
MKKNGLPKNLIAKNQSNISNLFINGHRLISQSFDLLYLPDQPKLTVLFAASKHFKTHVKKNEAKRLLRELFRKNKTSIPRNLSIALIAKKQIKKQKFTRLENEFTEMVFSAFR